MREKLQEKRNSRIKRSVKGGAITSNERSLVQRGQAVLDGAVGYQSGEIYNTRKASATIQSGLRAALNLIVDRKAPRIPGSLNRLKLWFLRLEKGNRIDERTPFYRHVSWPVLIKAITKIFSNERNLPQYAVDGFKEAYLEVEADQVKNLGPKSEFLPWSLDGEDKVKAVMSDKPKLPGFDDDAWHQSLDWVSSWLPKRSISLISLKEAIQGMHGMPKFALDTKTNAGFPSWVRVWYTTTDSKKTEARVQTQQYVLDRAGAIVKLAHSGSPKQLIDLNWVATTSQRTVQKGSSPLRPNEDGVFKGKRIVLAMPKEEAIAGKTVMAPLQESLTWKALNNSGIPIILGWRPMPQLDKGVQLFLDQAAKDGDIPLSGDISNFDASLPPWAMWDIATAMSEWMTPPAAKLFLSIMRADIFNTTVLTPLGVVGPGPSSVKSGSIFTSLVGCGANAAIQKYGEFIRLYTIRNICVMGDDFITSGKNVTPETMEKCFSAFGMKCNASKQFYKPNMVHFLQRLHVLGYPGGIGSVARVGGGALVVEDKSQLIRSGVNSFGYIFQVLARLENANCNPNFDDLAEWYVQGDKRYHLGKDFSPEAIIKRAGSHVERVLQEEINRPWTAVGSGVPFSQWAINRVIRGAKRPPAGKELFKWIYGIEYDSLNMDTKINLKA